jgi:biotin carboxyl carrier protein
VEVEPERIAALRERAAQGRAGGAHHGPLEIRAIIPGKVAAVSVAPGDAVTAGQQLLVVEAMKMQNELRAPRDGTIERVGVGTGVNIEVGDLLVVIS